MAVSTSQLLRESAERLSSSPAATPEAPEPNGIDATRDDLRAPVRDPVRYRPREAHEKYHLTEREIPKGMDATWVATAVRGARTRRIGEFIRGQWKPARAADFPQFSDYGLFDQSLVDMGVVQDVKPDSPVVLDDQMLMLRPQHFSKAAKIEQEEAARRQFEEHMKRVYDRSAREIGPQRTFVRHNYGPNDIVPDDDIDAR
jgi:hypothetical protein